jgi:hypothetical protein
MDPGLSASPVLFAGEKQQALCFDESDLRYFLDRHSSEYRQKFAPTRGNSPRGFGLSQEAVALLQAEGIAFRGRAYLRHSPNPDGPVVDVSITR